MGPPPGAPTDWPLQSCRANTGVKSRERPGVCDLDGLLVAFGTWGELPPSYAAGGDSSQSCRSPIDAAAADGGGRVGLPCISGSLDPMPAVARRYASTRGSRQAITGNSLIMVAADAYGVVWQICDSAAVQVLVLTCRSLDGAT